MRPRARNSPGREKLPTPPPAARTRPAETRWVTIERTVPNTDTPKGETVLVVDDEIDVRALVRDVLGMHGYHVLETGDPFEARRLVEKQPVHLLLTDVVMPIMNGLELAKRVEAVSPTTKVLLMSGYSTAAVKGSGRPLLPKPFHADELVNAVRQILNSRSAFRRASPPDPPKPG